MSKNPVVNAFAAAGYILLVVTTMSFVTSPLRNKPDTFFAPVIMLSVLTLSVSIMAYLFFYQPLLLFIANKKKEAVDLFIKTVAVFAALTSVGLFLLFTGII